MIIMVIAIIYDNNTNGNKNDNHDITILKIINYHAQDIVIICYYYYHNGISATAKMLKYFCC